MGEGENDSVDYGVGARGGESPLTGVFRSR
jgi:hypothetical protein